MKKFKSNPVTIEAVKWTGSNITEIQELMPLKFWTYDAVTQQIRIFNVREGGSGMFVGRVGDWICKSQDGVFYPVKEADFQRKYVELAG